MDVSILWSNVVEETKRPRGDGWPLPCHMPIKGIAAVASKGFTPELFSPLHSYTGSANVDVAHLSRLMTKPTKWHVCPVKTQISLGMHPVWSVFAVRMKKAWVLSYPLSAQQRLWCPGWSESSLGAQSFCWFVMRQLISDLKQLSNLKQTCSLADLIFCFSHGDLADTRAMWAGIISLPCSVKK